MSLIVDAIGIFPLLLKTLTQGNRYEENVSGKNIQDGKQKKNEEERLSYWDFGEESKRIFKLG